MHLAGLERHAGFVPRNLFEFPTGTIAVCQVSAETRRAPDGRALEGLPGFPEICAEPARPLRPDTRLPLTQLHGQAADDMARVLAGLPGEDLVPPDEDLVAEQA